MGESDFIATNIAALRPKAAQRAAARLQRNDAAKRPKPRRGAKPPADAVAPANTIAPVNANLPANANIPTTLPPDVAKVLAPPSGRLVSGAALATAVALASVSGFFGITGMTAIFAAAVVPIMVMIGVLEAAKLVTAAWLARHWRTAPLVLRLPLVAMVLLLMGLTAVGTFGFLSRAHLDHRIAATEAIDRDAAPLQQRIALAAAAVEDVEARIAQLDDMVKASTTRGRTKTAMALVNDQARSRGDLVAQRQSLAERLSNLKVEEADITGQRAHVANEAGPALYLAKLFGSEDTEGTVRLITALLVLVLDPLAVLLTLAAARRP
jgi:hypothetical protein